MEEYPDLSPSRITGLENLDDFYKDIAVLNYIKAQIDYQSQSNREMYNPDAIDSLYHQQAVLGLKTRDKFLSLDIPEDSYKFYAYTSLEQAVAPDLGKEDEVNLTIAQYQMLSPGSIVVVDPDNRFIVGVLKKEPGVIITKCSEDPRKDTFQSGLNLELKLTLPLLSGKVEHTVDVNKQQLNDMLIGEAAIKGYFDVLINEDDKLEIATEEAIFIASCLKDSGVTSPYNLS